MRHCVKRRKLSAQMKFEGDFDSKAYCADGETPWAALVPGSDGNL
jgi:hypothetical protein